MSESVTPTAEQAPQTQPMSSRESAIAEMLRLISGLNAYQSASDQREKSLPAVKSLEGFDPKAEAFNPRRGPATQPNLRDAAGAIGDVTQRGGLDEALSVFRAPIDMQMGIRQILRSLGGPGLQGSLQPQMSRGLQLASLASQGRNGDSELAHVNPREAEMLKDAGGAGTINPRTGLREYYDVTPGFGSGGTGAPDTSNNATGTGGFGGLSPQDVSGPSPLNEQTVTGPNEPKALNMNADPLAMTTGRMASGLSGALSAASGTFTPGLSGLASIGKQAATGKQMSGDELGMALASLYGFVPALGIAASSAIQAITGEKPETQQQVETRQDALGNTAGVRQGQSAGQDNIDPALLAAILQASAVG